MEVAPHEFDLPLSGFVGGAPEGIGQWPPEEVPEPEPLDIGGDGDPTLEFRRTLGMFATGVTVITTKVGDQVHGMTANAFTSVSLRPPLVLISVDRRARMHALLHEGKRYGISVLAADQEALSDHFAGRTDVEPVEARFAVVHETPLVEGAVAHLVAKVVRSYWGGDHSLFLGQVEYARYEEGRPLLFHGGRYARLVRGAGSDAALPAERLARLAAVGSERRYEDGEVILRAGEPGAELFVVLAGAVRLEQAGVLVRRLGEGEPFGEVAVLDGRPQPADAVAEGAVRCLAIPREALRAAIESDPQLAWELLVLLARRLGGS